MSGVAQVDIEASGLLFETLVAGPEVGETVILLHGYPQSAESWRETMSWLARLGYRSIAPNLRGYSPGANPREASAYSMDQLVGDVLGIADARGVDRFHLVGHDWGGAVAWAVAGSHPERLLSLTSVSTPHGAAMLQALRSSTQALRSIYMSFFRVPRVPELLMQSANFAQLGFGLRLFGQPTAAWARDRRQLQRVGMRGPLNWYRGALRGFRPRRVTVPTLYIWGRRDPFLGRRAAELTERYVTGEYLFEELDAGHWIIDRNPRDLQRLLEAHLQSHPEAAPPRPSQPRHAASAAGPGAPRRRPRARQGGQKAAPEAERRPARGRRRSRP